MKTIIIKLSVLWWVGTAQEGSKARMPILRRGARTEMGFTDGTYGHSHYLQDGEPV